MREFAREARALGVQYIGLCCGSTSNMLREIAVECGRKPPGLKYAPDPDNNVFTGTPKHKRSLMIRSRVLGTDPDCSV